MKIVSWNVNGIRSVYKKNFPEWLKNTDADIVCLQEIKAQEAELSSLFEPGLFGGQKYKFYASTAHKRGYSGVAVLAVKEPKAVGKNLGLSRFDTEGRILSLEYPDFTLINLYLPHGGRQKENLAYKLDVYQHLLEYLRRLKEKNIVLAGDFNVAHREVDLARPKENRNNTMFTEEERRQIDSLVKLGFTDSFRKFHPEDGHYTWWPYMAQARERNLGWRIDYIFVSNDLAPQLKDAFILKDTVGSDHCPVGVEISSV